MRIVIALGGNALLKRGESPTAENLQQNIERAAESIAPLAEQHSVILTHGNGPQVGLLCLQNEAYRDVPSYPLDVLDAESEGMIGYILERELRNRLPSREVVTVLTQVGVDLDDPAFSTATKPIGPVYEQEAARELARKNGWRIVPDGDGYRRAVPSPHPSRIVAIESIRLLTNENVLVICAGGGGIPVTGQEFLEGVEAVIDKDFTAALLAQKTEADLLMLLTDVEGVYADWQTPKARLFESAAPEVLAPMSFDEGSMGPKVLAACSFTSITSGRSTIGSIEDAARMLEGDAGTQVFASAATKFQK